MPFAGSSVRVRVSAALVELLPSVAASSPSTAVVHLIWTTLSALTYLTVVCGCCWAVFSCFSVSTGSSTLASCSTAAVTCRLPLSAGGKLIRFLQHCQHIDVLPCQIPLLQTSAAPRVPPKQVGRQHRPLIAAVTPAQPVVILCRSIRGRHPALRRQSPEPLTRNIPLCPAARGHVLFHCVPLIRQMIRRPAKTYPSVMYPKPQQPLPRPEKHLSSHIIYEQLPHFNSRTAEISLYWQRSSLFRPFSPHRNCRVQVCRRANLHPAIS